MKYLGIDFGTKRIGIAISDETGEFAFPKSIIPNSSVAVKKIATIAKEEEVAGIVIGDSVATNEEQNDIGSAVELFSHKLKDMVFVPIIFEREDFSSVEAHRYQTEVGHRDDSAAAIILQRFLDKKKPA